MSTPPPGRDDSVRHYAWNKATSFYVRSQNVSTVESLHESD